MNVETWNTAQIASYLDLKRRYVTDELTKKPDFPKPVINRSQRMRRWAIAAVKQWAQGGK